MCNTTYYFIATLLSISTLGSPTYALCVCNHMLRLIIMRASDFPRVFSFFLFSYSKLLAVYLCAAIHWFGQSSIRFLKIACA